MSSHPIQVPIHHAEEVEQVFDAISYCKGGSVVRMIRAVLGMPNFKKGLSNYMKKYAYGNTETLDLWSAWQVSSHVTLSQQSACENHFAVWSKRICIVVFPIIFY
jgi:puromycin-sensitive aminopeptidase